MALFNPATRTVIESAHMRAIYGLFKGVAGLEDNVLFVNNSAAPWIFRAKGPDPAADTALLVIQDASSVYKWRVTYDGQTQVRTSGPYYRVKDLAASGIDWRWFNTGNTLKAQLNTASEVSPTWVDKFTFDFSTGNLTITGQYNGTLTIVDGQVTTPKIADGAVTTPKIADANVTPAKLAGGTYNIHISGQAASAVTASFATAAGSAPPSGAAGGSLTGSYPNPTIAAGAVSSTMMNLQNGLIITSGDLQLSSSSSIRHIRTAAIGGVTADYTLVAGAQGVNNQYGLLNNVPTQRYEWYTTPGGIFTAPQGIATSGSLVFGVDVNLYRESANVLHTDDAFVSGGDITANQVGINQVVVGNTGGNRPGILLGTFGDTDWYRSSAGVLGTSGNIFMATGKISMGAIPANLGQFNLANGYEIRWRATTATDGGIINLDGSNILNIVSTVPTGASSAMALWTGGTQRMTIYGDGAVTFGSATKFGTAGTISAAAVYRAGTALDRVFTPEYQLLPIAEMQTYYEKNGHLPTIPTADVNNGEATELGALTDRLWETVEVQARYISELHGRLSILEGAQA